MSTSALDLNSVNALLAINLARSLSLYRCVNLSIMSAFLLELNVCLFSMGDLLQLQPCV